MTNRMGTPLGAAPAAAIGNTTPILTADANGGAQASPFGLPVLGSAPTGTPAFGTATTVFCTADSKIYQYVSGTTWKATAALT